MKRCIGTLITIKNVVQGRGHDCGGLICDVYFENKKFATYHDDGWGGEPETRIINDTIGLEAKVYFKAIKYAQDYFDRMDARGFTFITKKGVDGITFDELLEDVVVQLASEKLLDKDCKKGFCVGTRNRYAIHGFTNTKNLNELLTTPNNRKLLQDTYDASKQKGVVLNSVEQLKALGIKL